ncbi:hypothetical protein RF031_00020, partial [Acinetobacter baumannii]|nr:hypothetical protein [Acinetobacter baumannii]
VIPVLTIDRIAQYVASKEEHRKKLIKTIVNNPVQSCKKLLIKLKLSVKRLLRKTGNLNRKSKSWNKLVVI